MDIVGFRWNVGSCRGRGRGCVRYGPGLGGGWSEKLEAILWTGIWWFEGDDEEGSWR